MERPRLIICVNRRYDFDKPSCAARGSEAIADAIEQGIEERGLPVEVKRRCCLGQCENGPTLRLVPGNFILGVKIEDVPEILDDLAQWVGGPLADRKS